MGYVLKEDIADKITKKYKNSYIANELSLSGTYVSLILHRRQTIPKRIAYAFTKVIDNEAEVEEMFEEVE